MTVKWPDNRRELKGINLVSFSLWDCHQMLKPIMRKFAINLHHAYEQEKYQHSK